MPNKIQLVQDKANYLQGRESAKGVTFLLSLENTLSTIKQALAKDLGELWSIFRNVTAN